MKQLIKSAIVAVLAMSLCAGQSQFDLSRDVKGQLPVTRINPGVAGQCLTTNGSGATAWGPCASGSGTVTTFSAGTLSPLFTTSVSNPSTTPALSFTLSSFAAHTVFGNNTGSIAVPAAFQPKTTDLSDFNATAPSSSGKVPIWDQPSGTYIPGDPLVQGVFADASTSSANPVAIGGYDTAGTPALHRGTFINGTPAGTEYGIVVRNIPSGTQPISGSVSVSNFPATQPVSGSVSVSNFPATQTVAGTVTANQGGIWTVTANAGSGSFNVTGSVTANAGTNLNTSGLALETGGNLATLAGAVRAEDTASADADKGIGLLAIRKAAPANTSSIDGDYEYLQLNNGRLWTSSTIDNALPSGSNIIGSVKLTDGTNTQAVKPASSAAVAADPSSVTQISPNQPQLTTPLNVQGAKTNNNAAPGAANLGVLAAVANAAPPSYTEGNQTSLRVDLKGNLLVNNHPPDVLGCSQVNMRTSTYSGLSAGTPLLSIRWGDAAHLMVINHIRVNVITTVAATTAGQAEREIIIARSFTASDTGGTAITLTGNNQKMRTSFSTSLVTDMRVGTTITAGTRTLDANPVASAIAWLPLNMTGVDVGCTGASATSAAWSCVSSAGYIDLVNAGNGSDYPIVLAQNEGLIGRVGKDAMPAGATQQTYWQVGWCEVNAY
jgi:hypothetical protein